MPSDQTTTTTVTVTGEVAVPESRWTSHIQL